MADTIVDDPTRERPRRAADHIRVRGAGLLESPATDTTNKLAGGGFLSTPQDLTRFGSALLAGQIVSDASLELMFEPRKTANGEINRQRYGLGWRVAKLEWPHGSGEHARVLHHGGTSIGAQAVLLLIPEHQIAVAICANSYTGGSGALLEAAGFMARELMAAEATAEPATPDVGGQPRPQPGSRARRARAEARDSG